MKTLTFPFPLLSSSRLSHFHLNDCICTYWSFKEMNNCTCRDTDIRVLYNKSTTDFILSFTALILSRIMMMRSVVCRFNLLVCRPVVSKLLMKLTSGTLDLSSLMVSINEGSCFKTTCLMIQG